MRGSVVIRVILAYPTDSARASGTRGAGERHGPRRGRHRGPCWTIPAQCASRHVVALGD